MRPRSSLPPSKPYEPEPRKVKPVKVTRKPVGRMTAPSGRTFDIYTQSEKVTLLALGWKEETK